MGYLTVFDLVCDVTYMYEGSFGPDIEWVNDPIAGGGYNEGLAGFPLFPWVFERCEAMPVYFFLTTNYYWDDRDHMSHAARNLKSSKEEKKWRVRIFFFLVSFFFCSILLLSCSTS